VNLHQFLAPFQNRPGRVVAVGRLSLAVVFLVSLLVDHDKDNASASAVIVTAAYAVASAALLRATWDSWWRDHLLALPAHVADIIVFAILVLLTHGYTSPFYLFSLFLILSSTIRWGWRETLLTAAAVSAVFFLAGLYTAIHESLPLEVDRLILRSAYLLIMSLLLIWFSVAQESGRSVRSHVDENIQPTITPDDRVLELALERIPASRGLFIWWERDEPWVHVRAHGAAEDLKQRYGPDDFGDSLSEAPEAAPFLYDACNERALCIGEGGKPSIAQLPTFMTSDLPISWKPTTGVTIRIRASHHFGELILDSVPGLCRDDLKLAARLGEELSNVFDRYSAMNSTADRAVEKAKSALSHDLHDGVLQALSGVSFRLEALRSWIKAGRAPDEEISTLQRQLSEEQKNVRRFIHRLQNGRGPANPIDLRDSLPGLAQQIRQQWNIDCRLGLPAGAVTIPAWMEHPLKQIVREAAANAVRHAGAKLIECDLHVVDEILVLSIRNDGSGFALNGKFDDAALRERGLTPWSIYERTKSLGGNLSLFSNRNGSQLEIKLPMRESQ
jgi:signal transduction histidine kinase